MSIQIIKIFKESSKSIWQHKLEWLRVACAPTVITLLGTFNTTLLYRFAGHPVTLSQITYGDIYDFWDNGYVIMANLVDFVTTIVAVTSMLINGFRYAVLNKGGDRWWTLNINVRFWKMLGYIFLAMFLLFVYVLIYAVIVGIFLEIGSMALTVIIGTLLVLYGIYLAVRLFSLTFLLIAIDHKKPFRTNWHLLKGNVFRLIALMFLIALTIAGIFFVGGYILGTLINFLFWPLSLVSLWLSPAVNVVFWVLLGATLGIFGPFIFLKGLSLVYKALAEQSATPQA